MSKLLQFIEIDTPAWVAGSPIGPDITWRFAMPTEYLPADIDAIASVTGINYSAATISLGQDLGQRASLTVTFKDHKHVMGAEPFDSGSMWGKFRARYGQKLRGREVRLIRGYQGQQLADMETRYFYVDSTDGPTPDGSYTITCKDLLKFADDDRAQAPRLSNGSLAGSITISGTSATLSPAGIGNAEYPSSGYLCLGGKEIVSFTRSADTLTITRAQLGSTAIAHDAGDRAQLVLYYSGNDAADIISDLLQTYAGIDSDFIPLTDWQAETAAHLGGILYARAITEPTAVNKLVGELIEQAALAVWWDERARIVRLQVLKEIATDAAMFSEDVILEGSLKVKEQPDKRISQIWSWYGQRDPTDQSDKQDNYRAALATVDLAREDEYGSPIMRKITGTWVPTESAAERLNGIQISRFRDPPRNFAFDLFQGTPILAGTGYRLRWRQNQDMTGAMIDAGAPIQVTRVSVEAGAIHVEAEEMLASGTIVITKTVLLRTTGSVLTWTVPADWNSSDNRIECIGGGADASISFFRNGGGGGAYAAITNLSLTPGGSVSYRVGAASGDTWFNGATFGAASVGAKGASNATGGQASASIGTTKFSGGNGGSASGSGGGAGGGGSAGPSGPGANGGSNVSDQDGGAGGGAANGGHTGNGPSGDTGGNGGNNRFDSGGGNSTTPNGIDGGGGRGCDQDAPDTGGVGSQQVIWTQTIAPIISAGPAGGAGGGGIRDSGKNAAGYGAGGGSLGNNSSGVNGLGFQGIIAITWKPAI
jgi:hypothetical protein